MTEWIFVLTPLLVLPIILLFRFVGCGLDTVGEEQPILLPPRKDPPEKPVEVLPPVELPYTPVNYATAILAEPSVLAYWRLVDASSSTAAKDEKNAHPGTYKSGHALPPRSPTPTVAGSEGRNPAAFVHGKSSLIDQDVGKVTCRYFDGAHVVIENVAGLYTDQFTIEAWIQADVFDADYEYTLFDVGGNYAVPPQPQAQRGFRLFVDRAQCWQVRLGQGNIGLLSNPPLVPLGARTHIALTVANDGSASTQKKLTLYVNGKALPAISAYARPDNAALFIGIENDQANPASVPRLTHPLLCRVQEVVLHSKALTQGEIQGHIDINRK
jgi:hypothetical protein